MRWPVNGLSRSAIVQIRRNPADAVAAGSAACRGLLVERRPSCVLRGVDRNRRLRRDVERGMEPLGLTERLRIGEALTLGDLVIALGEVVDGTIMVAIRGPIGAGEIF